MDPLNPPGSPAVAASPAAASSPVAPAWLTRTGSFVLRHFDAVLVLLLMASLLFINYFVVHKFAFLMFYFLPVLAAGFYLGARHAVSAALLIAGFVTYLTLARGTDPGAGATGLEFWNVLVWAGFLILAGAMVGKLQEKNRFQMGQIRAAYVGIIQILTKYLESADAYTMSHSERVANVSVILARRMGLAVQDVQNIWTAGLLHDIGKIEVIDLIKKAAALDADEKTKVDQHTQLGAQIIMTTGSILQEAVPVVLDHHRRYEDGGDEIPLGARIVAVADTYDAVLTDRPYRAGRMHFQALEILKEGAGTQFDPKVVTAMERAGPEVERVYESARSGVGG
jgi:putative nucleotidyltransferase with HDIG domain